MNLRALWTSARRWYEGHSTRDRRIIATVAGAVALALVYVVLVEPVLAYRQQVAEEIGEGLEERERAARFLGAADSLRSERDELRQRFEQAKTHLVPGDSAALGAAALQERANAIAAEKGITVQSTQVMREEAADPFRKIAVRLTLSGELRPFAEFIAGLEYGPQQLTLPFVEVSRRGAVAGARGPRSLAATVEVSGYILSGEQAAKAEAEAAEAAEAGAEGAPQAEAPAGVAGEAVVEKPAAEAAAPAVPAPPPAPGPPLASPPAGAPAPSTASAPPAAPAPAAAPTPPTPPTLPAAPGPRPAPQGAD